MVLHIDDMGLCICRGMRFWNEPPSLVAEDLSGDLPGYAVHQQGNKRNEQQEEQSTNDVPLVVVPDDEFESLPGRHEPHERRLRSAIEEEQNQYMNSMIV